jgi:hypothetical protein
MTLEEALDAITKLERSERVKRGLPPHHVLEWSEFPFAFATKQVGQLLAGVEQAIAQNPANYAAYGIHSFLKALQGDFSRADESMRLFQKAAPLDPIRQIRFTEPPGERAALPAVTGSWPTAPSLFVSCDAEFFRQFTVRLLKSIARHAPGTPVHVHLMSPRFPEHPDFDVRITKSTEDPSSFLAANRLRPPEYYHAARFVRFSEALEQAPALLMMDADCLATGDPRTLLENENGGARVRPGRIEPWSQFSGCLVRGTVKSRPYFRRAADIIRSMITKPFWGLDQFALFAAYLQERPELELFGPDICSVVNDEPGLFWFTAGAKKSNLDADNTGFAKLYRSYG